MPHKQTNDTMTAKKGSVYGLLPRVMAVAVAALLCAATPALADNDRMPGRMDRVGDTVEAPPPAANTRTRNRRANDNTEQLTTEDTPQDSRRSRRARRAAEQADTQNADIAPPPRKPAMTVPHNSDLGDRTAGITTDRPAQDDMHQDITDKKDSADKKDQEKAQEQDNNKKPAAIADAPQSAPASRPAVPRLAPVREIPIAQLELSGLLTTPAERSLGIDMWHGTDRATVNRMLPAIPALSRYRTLQDLTTRLMLTETEVGVLRGGRAQAGEDLMTLRLEKLLDIGAYDDAARLYALNPGRPYHERLARAGVSAMLLGERRALGCLEVKALADDYKSAAFWQQADAICTIYMAGHIGKGKSSAVDSDVFDGLPALKRIADSASYKFRPDNMAELAKLSAIERIGVFSLERVDYNRIAKLSLADILRAEPAILSAMLSDSSLPPRLRLFTTIAAVATGSATTPQLAALYESDSLAADDDGKSGRGWKALPSLYKQAKSLSLGKERDAALQQVLALRRTFGTSALQPFAPMLAESDPGNLPPESIAASLAVMVKAGQDIPTKWRQLGLAVLSPEHRGGDDALAFFAFDISQGFTPLKAIEATELQPFFRNMEPHTAKIVKTIYEKLDSSKKLHNIGVEKEYEKDPILTAHDDYVMPVADLMNDLTAAKKDKRLGEVILISSILLRSTPTGKITPEVLGEVLDGYKTVGLTKEARELAAEVVLGLRK